MPDVPVPQPDSHEPGGETAAERLEREAWREAVTMALYVALSLLAVLLATPVSALDSRSRLALDVALTAVGLLLAHLVAFTMSTRLLYRGAVDEESARLIGAQVAGGLAVAVLATVPVLLFGSAGVRVSGLLLLGVVALVGYVTARARAMGRVRALMYVLGVVVVVGIVLVVKGLAGH